MLSPNELPPSRHWEFLECQQERCKYLPLPETRACVSCVPYLGTGKLKEGEKKIKLPTEQGSQITWEKNFLNFSRFLKKALI